jgi:exodeoxyribonuclease-3
VKVATFNINNINKRLDNLLAWLKKEEPDVVSLQELKAEQGAFPKEAVRSLGYEAVWAGERSWNGVAILARKQTPVVTRSTLPGDPQDRQARYLEAAVQGILVASILPSQWKSAAWAQVQLANSPSLAASSASRLYRVFCSVNNFLQSIRG